MTKDNEILIADKAEVKSFAKSIRNWLSIELTIQIFGITVLAWKFPPDSDKPISN